VSGAPDPKNPAFHSSETILPAPTGHMVFTGRCLEAGRTALPRVCNDPPGPHRRRGEDRRLGAGVVVDRASWQSLILSRSAANKTSGKKVRYV